MLAKYSSAQKTASGKIKMAYTILPFGWKRSKSQKKTRRPLALECLEGRITPATGSFNSSTGTISFNYTATGSTAENVTLTNNGTTITASGNVSGTTSFTTSNVKAILITASGNSTGQSLSLNGTSAYSLSSGLSVTGIDSVTVNASINTGVSDISMSLGNGIAINSPLSTSTGNIVIAANNGASSSTGNFYGIHASANVTTAGGNIDWTGRAGTDSSGGKVGILIDNGSTISAGGSGFIKFTGTGGASTGVYNHGIAVIGKNTARSTIVKTLNGDITINGTGGGIGANTSNNYGVYVQIGGVISAGGVGSLFINGKGGSASGVGNMGLFIDADQIAADDSTFVGASDGSVIINVEGGANGAQSLGFRGRGQIGSLSNYSSLASSNNNLSISLTPGQGGTIGIYNETSLGKIISGSKNITIYSDYYSNFWGKTSLYSTSKISLFNKSIGFNSGFSVSKFLSAYLVNPNGNGFADLNNGLEIGAVGNNAEVAIDSPVNSGGNITINSQFTTVSKSIASTNGSISITSLQAISIVSSITTSQGNITLSANTSPSPVAGDFYGIRISADLTTAGGNILVTGRGGDSSNGQKHGVLVDAGASLKATGSGAISLNGIGGNSSGASNCGVFVTAGSKLITTGSGKIEIIGNGGSGNSGGNSGIWIDLGSSITASGTGVIVLTGTGGIGTGSSNIGVYIGGSTTTVSEAGSSLSITAISSIGSLAFQLDGGAVLACTSGGDVQINADSFAITGATPCAIKAASGSISIRNRTMDTSIDLGGVDNYLSLPLKLGLSGAELDCMTAGKIFIGRMDSYKTGIIQVVSSVNRSSKTDLVLLSGNNIIVSGGGISVSGGSITLSCPSNFGIRPSKTDTDFDTGSLFFGSGSCLELNVNSDNPDIGYDRIVSTGQVDLSGSSLRILGSGNISLGSTLTLISGNSLVGQFSGLPNGSILNIGGFNFKLEYLLSSVTIMRVQAPIITSANAFSFNQGVSGSFTVSATGVPQPIFSIISGSLPSGVDFNSSTGILSGAPAAGSNGSYSLVFQADNKVGAPVTQSFNLTVNRSPSGITLSGSTVSENSASGTAVGTFTTTDPDAGDTFTYSLVTGTGSTDNGVFQIVSGALQTAALFDYETKSSYSIRVRTTDQGGLSFEQVFTITVTDVNEAPTALSLSALAIAENSTSGSSVGTFSTTDPDTANTFTYSLVTGTGSTDNGVFQIVSGALKTAAVFDYETKSSYSIRVRTTDQGGLSFEQVFTVSVTVNT